MRARRAPCALATAPGPTAALAAAAALAAPIQSAGAVADRAGSDRVMRGAGRAAARPAPLVGPLGAFRNGRALAARVRASATGVSVGRKRCVLGAATPLAALVRARPGALRLNDYGSCSRRAADAGGLYVRSIRGERGRGQNGWVYKVGHKLATAGAADPAGPFGRGRLRSRQRVTWFFCIYRRGCQRTLSLRAAPQPGGLVSARVRGYDDSGKGVAVAGASVSVAGRAAAVTDAAGLAQLRLPAGRHTMRAAKAGLVRAFAERVTVR